MSPANNLSRLPDELIIEIFRNRILSQEDLYSCSLVSRRFTKEVNKCLYEKVDVDLVTDDEAAENGQGAPRARTQYSVESWRLIRTLVDKPELARNVRIILFSIRGRYDDEADDEGKVFPTVDTTESLAVSTILDLATSLKKISFYHQWAPTNDDWNAIKRHQTIDSLEPNLIRPELLRFIAQHLPRIKHLSSPLLDANADTLPPFFPKGLENLNFNSIHGSGLENSFVMANCSTLRSLEIPLEVCLDLDFSLFPNLHALHLGRDVNSRSVSESAARKSGRKFWDSLPTSPSLRTLSFDGNKYRGAHEEALFPSYYYSSDGPSKPIPTLRTIRFRGDIVLDRTNMLLSGPIATTLERVAIPSRLFRKSAGPLLKNRAEFVMAICKKKGIEVIFADA